MRARHGGMTVIGVDPAEASLDVACGKPGADAVRWVTATPPCCRSGGGRGSDDGERRQVFLTDEEWAGTLRGCRSALRPGGRLIFETRDPARRSWEEWTVDLTRQRLDIPGVGVVETWHDVSAVEGEFVTFQWTIAFASDGAVFKSSSTLRFRPREAIEVSLRAADLILDEVRDAPDRPGRELVFVAHRPE